MDLNRKPFSSHIAPGPQAGNAMIYVLLVIALFAALGFLLMRGSNTNETDSLTEEKDNIYTGQIMGAPMQMKQALDQMTYSGAHVNKVLPADHTVNFALPQDSVNFSSGSNADKFFHPEGGGAIMPHLPDESVSKIGSADPAPGWYVGRFNNVEWTPSDKQDVVMTAYQIAEKICAQINQKLTGSDAIPVLSAPANRVLIADAASATAGANIEFTSADCTECYGQPAMCVRDGAAGPFAFYSVIGAE
jgi:hypothetical protein